MGTCHCGCGQPTNRASKTSRRRGIRKGEFSRYRRGHHGKKEPRYRVKTTGYETPCWIWLLSKTLGGYGQVAVGAGTMGLAHRIYYEAKYGPVPAGLELDHLCGVRECVNPEHLEPVTHAENTRRGRGAKLSATDARAIRESSATQRVLARRYGITQPQVSKIKHGLSWGDAPAR